MLNSNEHLGLPGELARDERTGTECDCSLVEEKQKKEGFIYFLVYKRRERVREREENGPLQRPLGGGRILDYFGAHSTTHPNQHQYENTDTSHHPASIIPALASVPQR